MKRLQFLAAAISMSMFAYSAPLAMAENDVVRDLPAETQISDLLPIWTPSDGDQIRFEVLRKGKPFGFHTVRFDAADENGFTATAEVELTAKFGPIVAYKYRHDSVETWEDGHCWAECNHPQRR